MKQRIFFILLSILIIVISVTLFNNLDSIIEWGERADLIKHRNNEYFLIEIIDQRKDKDSKILVENLKDIFHNKSYILDEPSGNIVRAGFIQAYFNNGVHKFYTFGREPNFSNLQKDKLYKIVLTLNPRLEDGRDNVNIEFFKYELGNWRRVFNPGNERFPEDFKFNENRSYLSSAELLNDIFYTTINISFK